MMEQEQRHSNSSSQEEERRQSEVIIQMHSMDSVTEEPRRYRQQDNRYPDSSVPPPTPPLEVDDAVNLQRVMTPSGGEQHPHQPPQQHHAHPHAQLMTHIPIAQVQMSASVQSWNRLPGDLLHLVAQSLDGRTLVRLSAVDRFSHSITRKYHHALWSQLVVQQPHPHNGSSWMTTSHVQTLFEFEQQPISNQLRAHNPFRYYLSRRQLILSFRNDMRFQHQKKLNEIMMQRRANFCRLYEEAILPTLIWAFLLAFLVLLVIQLQRTDNSTISFAPFWLLLIPVILIGLSMLNLSYLNHRAAFAGRARSDPSTGLLPETYGADSRGFLPYIMYFITGDENSDGRTVIGRGETCVANLFQLISYGGVAIWILLIALKVTAHITTAWTLIFIPLFLAFLPLIVCQFMPWRDQQWWLLLLLLGAIGVAPLITFLGMLLSYLYSGGIKPSSLHYVFIPLYIYDVAIIVTVILTLRSKWRPFERIAIAISTSGPIFAFELLLALKIDGTASDLTYAGVFIPLFLQFAFFLLFIVKHAPSKYHQLKMEFTSQRIEKDLMRGNIEFPLDAM